MGGLASAAHCPLSHPLVYVSMGIGSAKQSSWQNTIKADKFKDNEQALERGEICNPIDDGLVKARQTPGLSSSGLCLEIWTSCIAFV